MVTDEPIDHVKRPPLPWRDDELTECGKRIVDVASVVTRDEVIVKVKKQGRQRAAMSTCMTCWTTTARHRDWAQSPCDVLARWLERVHWGERRTGNSLMDRELRAIAALIEVHREEFDAYVAGLEAATSLDELRERRRRKAH